jgi:biopolymer transport protein ExbD
VPEKSDSWTEPLIVRLKDAGAGREPIVYVGSTLTSWVELPGRLKDELSRRRDWVVYVEGDDDLAYQNVVNVIGMARGLHARVVLVGGVSSSGTGSQLPFDKLRAGSVPTKNVGTRAEHPQ